MSSLFFSFPDTGSEEQGSCIFPTFTADSCQHWHSRLRSPCNYTFPLSSELLGTAVTTEQLSYVEHSGTRREEVTGQAFVQLAYESLRNSWLRCRIDGFSPSCWCTLTSHFPKCSARARHKQLAASVRPGLAVKWPIFLSVTPHQWGSTSVKFWNKSWRTNVRGCTTFDDICSFACIREGTNSVVRHFKLQEMNPAGSPPCC